MEHINKEYSATNKMLKKLLAKKYITSSKRTGGLGGAELEYSLAKSEIEFLKKVANYLSEILGLQDKNK